MAKRFAINGKYLGQPQSGVQRVAAELTRALDDLAGQDTDTAAISFRILRPPGSRPAEVSHIPQAVVGAGSGPLWEQFSLPRHTGGDILLNLCNMAPVTASGDVIVIHDAQAFLAPKSYSLAFRTWYRAVIPLLAARARRVVTVSNYSRDRLAEYGVAARQKIGVIHNGVDHISRIDSDAAVLDRLGLRAKAYVATLSNTQHHKNIGVLFEAFRSPELAEVPLLLIGGAQAADFERQGLSPPPNAIFTGRVSDGELKSLMEHAAVFAFPSLTEGFGLPPLEAMLLGTPALIAPCGAMPEVCGDAALYAAPDRPAEWTAALARLLADSSLRRALSQRGRLQAARYRWSDTARQYLDLLQAV
jgi:glycosyltransferase involved in cell wall biosynthesis